MRGPNRGSRHHRGEQGWHHRGGHHGHGEERLGRMLGHGDLRYLILSMLEEKPRHGYELIKALEEFSSGAYVPSPGAIYPTLTYLEEGGFATASTEQNKKQYTITDEGRALLDQNRGSLKELRDRFAKLGEKISRLRHWMGRDDAEEVGRDERSLIRKAMHSLKAELFSFVDATKEKKQQVAEIIERATEEIKKIKS